MSSLKQFIRNVRASKTIADERAVVHKESAAIRASFREESHNSDVRRNNVAKLLYLFTLGERTHFGQIECLKLLASPRFADKRLGYLGTMLLLDENQEVLTLVTNSLKNDLNHSNQYIVGLALCTLGNIASVEMSRDLFPEIETILGSTNPYVRRKAALCAMRICRKVPDLQEHFVDKARMLLSDRNHGVLLTGLTLVTSMCEQDEEEGSPLNLIATFRPLTGSLVKVLKNLSQSGYAPEHDVTGITDPFLQVKLLRLLRVLGRNDAHTSEQINDILAQVATNTDSSKNVGNSILYEAVLTILDIEADSGLRVLGVNILGKFLANKDNNIRYVALNTLIKVVALEPNAVQRHRNTVLDCLRDPDISIRRRALDLSFTLVNESNAKVLIRELLSFLEVADAEFKPTLTSQISLAAERYAPTKRWHVDTLLRVLKLAGNYVKEEILSSFVRLVATSPDLQSYCARRLYEALREDISQEGLTLAGSWVIGEYGDALLRSSSSEDASTPVHESEVVDLLTTILNSSYAGQIVTEYIVTCAMKLTTRLSEPAQVERLRRLLLNRQADLDIEVQQRAVEYGNLFGHEDVRRGVLERMPVPEARPEGEGLTDVGPQAGRKKTAPKAAAVKKTRGGRPAERKEEDMLLDLMGGDPPAVANGNGNGNASGHADLLADIMGDGAPLSAPAISNGRAAVTNASSGSGMASLMDLFDSPSTTTTATPSLPQPPPQQQTTHTAYNAQNLLLTLSLSRANPQTIAILAKFTNKSPLEALRQVNLQAAVPKTQKLVLQPISSGEIVAGGGESTQGMRVQGVGGVSEKLRREASSSQLNVTLTSVCSNHHRRGCG